MIHLYDDNVHQTINVAVFEVLVARKDLIAYVSKITSVASRKINKMIKEKDVDFEGNYQILENIIDSIKGKKAIMLLFHLLMVAKQKAIYLELERQE